VQQQLDHSAQIPHATPLFEAFLHDFPRVQAFFARPPCPTEWFTAEAQRIHFDPERRTRVAEVLEAQNRAVGASEQVFANIERLRAGACAAVTGQQVGLFGGPLFSLLKAISAVRAAEEASRLGVDCVPVFWLATEDHDLAEIDHIVLPERNGALHTVAASPPAVKNSPVGEIRFGAEVEAAIEQAVRLVGEPLFEELLRASYFPGAGFGEAFGRLFARIFADLGVILLDATSPGLHRIAAPIYCAAVRQAADLDAAILERGEALRAAGFHEQVKVTSSSTLLFAVRDGSRIPIHRSNGKFTAGDLILQQDELTGQIEAAPQNFSANVLLRPVVQDYLLPTLAYVGGPAEVAYFAQAAVVYKALVGRVTPVLPRLMVTLVEPHVKRLLDRYDLSVPGTFISEEQLRDVMAQRTLPSGLTLGFDAARSQLGNSMRAIIDSLQRLDPTLVQSADKSAAKMRHQLDRLQTRAAHAELRRNEILLRHAAQLSTALYPQGTLQERTISGVYFFARYPSLLQRLQEAASRPGHEHQVIFL
jgi:bacillithiol synthase